MQSVAYLGGKSENIFWQDTLLKIGFQPIYFAQKYTQNAGNAVSETQISKHFRGGMPPDPLKLCRHYGLPLTKILATPLPGRIYVVIRPGKYIYVFSPGRIYMFFRPGEFIWLFARAKYKTLFTRANIKSYSPVRI